MLRELFVSAGTDILLCGDMAGMGRMCGI